MKNEKFLTESARIAAAYGKVLNENTNDVVSTEFEIKPEHMLSDNEKMNRQFADFDYDTEMQFRDAKNEGPSAQRFRDNIKRIAKETVQDGKNFIELGKKVVNKIKSGVNNDNNSKKNESVEEGYNKTEYKFYSIIETKDGWKINGGWEFKEDAIDDANEIKETCKDCDSKVKVVGTRAVTKYVGNPDDVSSWVSGMYADAMAESKDNMLDIVNGFYDKPRSNEEILDEFNSIAKEHIIGCDKDGSPIYVHYDVRDNSLWANVNDEHVEIQFERDRSMDYNLDELYSKITEVTEIN